MENLLSYRKDVLRGSEGDKVLEVHKFGGEIIAFDSNDPSTPLAEGLVHCDVFTYLSGKESFDFNAEMRSEGTRGSCYNKNYEFYMCVETYESCTVEGRNIPVKVFADGEHVKVVNLDEDADNSKPLVVKYNSVNDVWKLFGDYLTDQFDPFDGNYKDTISFTITGEEDQGMTFLMLVSSQDYHL